VNKLRKSLYYVSVQYAHHTERKNAQNVYPRRHRQAEIVKITLPTTITFLVCSTASKV